MKKFLSFLVKILICVSIISLLLVAFLFFCPYSTYEDSYQSVIQNKYDYLKNIKGEKIIIIGGSSAGFGIDEEKIEAETGYKVANLGLHAGFGAIVPSELAKVNIAKGDIVVLAYEWGWHESGYFDILGTDLVISGFGSRLDMYKQLPPRLFPRLIGYLGNNFKKKLYYEPTYDVYSKKSFDENGRMILDRPKTWMTEEKKNDPECLVDLGDGSISEDSIQYLKEYKAFIEKKGATVCFAAPPIYDGMIVSTMEIFERFIKQVEEKTGIPYISHPKDYFFPAELIFDTAYHCSNSGEAHRTELLISDLKKIL